VATEPKSNSAGTNRRDAPVKTLRVLLVGDDLGLGQVIEKSTPESDEVQITTAKSLTEARARLTDKSFEIAVINPGLPDGNGLDLADELNKSRRRTATILVGDEPNLEAAMQAIRAGASDYLVSPLDINDANERIRKVIAKQRKNRDQAMDELLIRAEKLTQRLHNLEEIMETDRSRRAP